MASQGVKVFCLFFGFIALANATGDLDILHSPESIKFTGHNVLQQSSLKELYSAALGLSVEEGSDWSGLYITDPFNTPEAVVTLYIDGVSTLGNKAHIKAHRYPLITDEYDPDTFVSLVHRINQRYTEGGNNIVNINLSDDEDKLNEYSSVFGHIKMPKVSKKALHHLKPGSVDEHFQFLKELEVLKEIVRKVENGAITPDNAIDFYYFTVQSLHPLSDLNGADSLATKEAKALLGEVAEELNRAFVNAYDGSVLVTIVTSDASHTRRATRSLKQATEAPVLNWNLAKRYSSAYPVMFNIILWFGIVFVFAMLAIVYAIMDMDPGRDSIIYRMTSNRIKKDN